MINFKPGSKEAIDVGCLCPVLDNAHGKGYRGGVKDDNGETLYVYSELCPLHGHKIEEQKHEPIS